MAFSGRLGGTNSQPGALRLGSGEPASGGGSTSSFFVGDAVIRVFGFGQGSFAANAVFRTADNAGAFGADAYVAWWFHADAIILAPISASLTADADIQYGFTLDAFIFSPASIRTTQALSSVAVLGGADVLVTQSLAYVNASPYPDGVRLRATQSAAAAVISDTAPATRVTQALLTILQKTYPQITADATLRVIAVEESFSADARLAGRITADAIVLATFGDSMENTLFLPTGAVFTSANVKLGAFEADAYLAGGLLTRHDRTVWHSGVDRDVDHILAVAIGRFSWRTPIVEVLIDLDARITAMEMGGELRYGTFTTDAVIA